MRAPRWASWALLGGAVVLAAWSWFVLGFLSEPSAVANLRIALIVIGAGSIVLAVAALVAGVWMLLSRRT